MIDLLDDGLRLHSGAPWWLVRNGLDEPAASVRQRCDIAVIGAGLTGTMLADRLTMAGADVVLVDRRAPGYGSTAVSTALVQYEIDVSLVDLARMIGTEDAARAYRLSFDAVAELGELAGEFPDRCGHAARPSLYLAATRSAGDAIVKEERARAAAGIDAAHWTAAQVRERYGFRSHGALRTTHAAVLDPVRLTRALLERCTARGAGLLPRTAASAVTRRGDRFVVHTDRGELEASQVVLAIGYEIPDSLVCSGIAVSSTYAAVTEPLDDLGPFADGTLLWESRRPYTYVRTTDEGRIIIGGGDEPFSSPDARDRLMPARTRMLDRTLRRLAPGLDARLEFSWAGTFIETADGLPIIGAVPGPPGVWYALGYGGNGITFSVIAARILSSLCLGRDDPDAQLFRADRPSLLDTESGRDAAR